MCVILTDVLELIPSVCIATTHSNLVTTPAPPPFRTPAQLEVAANGVSQTIDAATLGAGVHIDALSPRDGIWYKAKVLEVKVVPMRGNVYGNVVPVKVEKKEEKKEENKEKEAGEAGASGEAPPAAAKAGENEEEEEEAGIASRPRARRGAAIKAAAAIPLQQSASGTKRMVRVRFDGIDVGVPEEQEAENDVWYDCNKDAKKLRPLHSQTAAPSVASSAASSTFVVPATTTAPAAPAAPTAAAASTVQAAVVPAAPVAPVAPVVPVAPVAPVAVITEAVTVEADNEPTSSDIDVTTVSTAEAPAAPAAPAALAAPAAPAAPGVQAAPGADSSAPAQ